MFRTVLYGIKSAMLIYFNFFKMSIFLADSNKISWLSPDLEWLFFLPEHFLTCDNHECRLLLCWCNNETKFDSWNMSLTETLFLNPGHLSWHSRAVPSSRTRWFSFWESIFSFSLAWRARDQVSHVLSKSLKEQTRTHSEQAELLKELLVQRVN